MSSMSLQLPEGLTCRPLTRDDAALVAQLATEDEVALGREARLAAADVLSWWIRFDVSEGSWLVEEAGRPIALGWIEVHDETAFGASSVRPGAKGRGLGTLLVEHAEMRARERGATRVLQHALGEDEAAHALLERFGYSAARRHYEMAIELSTPPPAPEELPDDLVLDMFRDEDAREFHDAIAEAFADEWGFVRSRPVVRRARRDPDRGLRSLRGGAVRRRICRHARSTTRVPSARPRPGAAAVLVRGVLASWDRARVSRRGRGEPDRRRAAL
jgi:GNAT superfamily N-acetyltransferase